jgi:aspartate-semialdehyde dehydrogenase
VKAAGKKLRIGVTDPEGPLARHLRDVFAQSGIPVSRFVPLAAEKDAGTLHAIEEETEITVAPARETVGDLDLLVLAGSSVDAEARRIAAENDVPIWDAAETPAAAFGCEAILESAAPESAAFVLFLPAAEEGTAGIQELFRQTGDALNFRDTEAAVFGGRLAFNVLRDARSDELGRRVAARLAARFPACPASVLAARVALFHGYAGGAVLRFADGVAAKRAAGRLRTSAALSPRKEPGASPAAAIDAGGVIIDPPEVHGDTLTLWFAFDGLALAAESVLHRARALLP